MSSKSYAQYYNPYTSAFQQGLAIGNAVAQKEKYARSYIRKSINGWNQCKNGTLSLEHGAVALYGSNGYCYTSSVDNRLSSKLSEINKGNMTIDDVNITEQGYFVVLYNNGNNWYGVLPSQVKSTLESYNSSGTIFRSISFNDNGTYAITTTKGFKSNNQMYQSFYDDNSAKYGTLLSVNINKDGAVFCFSNKTCYCGNIPIKVENAVESFGSRPKFVKFNEKGDFLICSESEIYSYYIEDVDKSTYAQTTNHVYVRETPNNSSQQQADPLKTVIHFGPYSQSLIMDSAMKEKKGIIKSQNFKNSHEMVQVTIANDTVFIYLFNINEEENSNEPRFEIVSGMYFRTPVSNIIYNQDKSGNITGIKMYDSETEFIVSKDNYTVLMADKSQNVSYGLSYKEDDIYGNMLQVLGVTTRKPEEFSRRFNSLLSELKKMRWKR